MTAADPDQRESDLEQLRALLQAATPVADPAAGLGRLQELRTAAAGPDALARDLCEAEGRWLRAEAHGRNELAAAATACGDALLRLRARSCSRAPADDVDALFEVAMAIAGHRQRGDAETADALAAQLVARLEAVTDTDRLCQEADERWAQLTGADDDRPLREQVSDLRATGMLLRELADRNDSARLRRRSRRALRAADDRELQARLEALLGHRGVIALETGSFVLLLLVLVVLVVEATVALTDRQLVWLHWVDGLACAFFVAEFGLKLALAPHRGSWFLRNVLTDLLPALPAVLWLLPGPALPGAADDVVMVRLLRLLRVTWAARYVQALRPLLRTARLVLLMVRGMDGLVRRFRSLLDRNFVFLAGAPVESVAQETRRDVVFAALVRERSLFAALPADRRHGVLAARLAAVTARADALPGAWQQSVERAPERDIPVERACEFLWSLRASDVDRYLRPADLRALDRVARVVSTAPLCWLPILRRFAVRPQPAQPEERVIALGRNVADWLIGWQDRLQFFADLHGIVTGPQILDRVASAMVKASQRPAVRLLLFGGLFLLFDLLIGNESVSRFLKNIVVGPLLILGSFCLVTLGTGWWLKRVAGEANETFRLLSEAHFVSLLSLSKRRHERADTEFLGERVLADVTPGDPVQLLRLQLAGARAGVPVDVVGFDDREERLGSAVALLYLHFLDGALLHGSDVKTTEQLLANLALDNLRQAHLGYSRRDKKRLWQLRLDDGSVLRGPFLWFRFITESITVETSKRIAEYNRRCVPLERLAELSPARRQALHDWLQQRRDPKAGRTVERLESPDAASGYTTTEFHALHFLTVDRARDDHVRALFGDEVLAALQQDRRNMIREIFGMRPARELASSTRAFNAWNLYWSRLSHGRVFLLPVWAIARAFGGVWWFGGRMRQIVREVLRPQLAQQQRESGAATFGVALRKIHRMKAPGLLEAIRTRLALDPVYGGAPAGWSDVDAAVAHGRSQLERDLDFLQLHERERAVFRDQAAWNREHVATLHAALSWLPPLGDPQASAALRRDAELAVTVAWLSDRDAVRTLLAAEPWRLGDLPEILQREVPIGLLRRACWAVQDLFGTHPTAVFARRQGLRLARRERRNLRAAWVDEQRVRAVIAAWNALPAGTGPAQAALDRLRAFWRGGEQVRRELTALRAIQSLSVLDVRNYREAVFEIGGYQQDGEDPAPARSLP
ncbi:MAG: hypothetical protein AB7O97_06270 [Planctomycetota bacterium]